MCHIYAVILPRAGLPSHQVGWFARPAWRRLWTRSRAVEVETADWLEGRPPEASTTEQDVADAVRYLAGQSPRGWTHELQITPRLDRWVP